jgi:hypothetical protein
MKKEEFNIVLMLLLLLFFSNKSNLIYKLVVMLYFNSKLIFVSTFIKNKNTMLFIINLNICINYNSDHSIQINNDKSE